MCIENSSFYEIKLKSLDSAFIVNDCSVCFEYKLSSAISRGIHQRWCSMKGHNSRVGALGRSSLIKCLTKCFKRPLSELHLSKQYWGLGHGIDRFRTPEWNFDSSLNEFSVK